MKLLDEAILFAGSRRGAPLSDLEVTLLVLLMDRVRWPVPQQVFEAWEGNFYNCAVELGIGRPGEEEVFLVRRPNTDRYYPGQWHMPGKVILPGMNIQTTLAALIDNELGGVDLGHMTRIDTFEFSKVDRPRGQGVCFLFHASVDVATAELLPNGQFFPVDQLPEPMIGHHIPMIRRLFYGRGISL